MMTMKARFPETGEDVIADVLNQCGQNIDMATRELNNMGYAGRQKAAERRVEYEIKPDDFDKDKRRKVKEDREQHLRQLKNEFEGILDADIATVFESCSHDLYETRTTLRRREADMRGKALAAMETQEMKATAIVPVVTVQESVTTTTIGDSVVTIERRPLDASDPAAEHMMQETVIVKPLAKVKKLKDNTVKQMTMPKVDTVVKVHETMSKSTNATPSHRPAATAWVSLAKGPDPNMRRGSDPNLRSGASRALGPDPNLRLGANPELRHAIAGRSVAVLAAQ